MLVRTVSALMAVLLLIFSYVFFKEDGLFWTTFVVMSVANFELASMVGAKSGAPKWFTWFHFLSAMIAFSLLVFAGDVGHSLYPLFLVSPGIVLLILNRHNPDSQSVFYKICVGAACFFYATYMPHFACQLLSMEDGAFWFLYLLAIPSAGDTFAYFGGRFWGKEKAFPYASPGKTVEGCYVGLLGSMLAASTLVWFYPVKEALLFPFLGLVMGLFAQQGDFFESLIKRSSGVKDSGHIFPGHGGLLDRIDGVIFSCPALYGFVMLLPNIFPL